IEVSGYGNWPVTGVRIQGRLPEGLRHSSGGRLEADLGTLTPGETARLTLRVRATQAGTWRPEAAVTSREGGQATGAAEVCVTAPALMLRAVGPALRLVGEEAEIRLDVSNPGTAPATNVRVLAAWPEGLEFVTADGDGTHNPQTRKFLWTLG